MIVNRRIDVPVRDDQIFPSVVIIIEKACAPTQKWNCQLTQPSLEGHVREISITVVVIQYIRIVRKICDMKIKLAVVVIISDSETHTSLLATVLVKREA